MPSTVTLATSAPRPPVGPPPAAGACGVAGGGGAGAVGFPFEATALGVATFGVFFAGAFRSLSAFMRDGSGVSRATGGGATAAGAGTAAAAGAGVTGEGCTSPTWRGPAGAAIRFTRYVG